VKGIGEVGGEGEWGPPTHYFRHKSCIGAGNAREGRREGKGEREGLAPKGTAWIRQWEFRHTAPLGWTSQNIRECVV